MGQLMLMAGLDERFGIQLSNEELTKLRARSAMSWIFSPPRVHLELACPRRGRASTSPQLERLGPPLARTLGLSFEGLLEAFRPATALADGPAILALRRTVIGNALWWDDEQFVRWRYFDAEFGGHPRLSGIDAWKNQIVGFVGSRPVVLVVDGRPYEATRTLDIMVRPDFEGRGIGGFMNLVLLQRFPVSMVTGSNAQSHRLIGRSWQHILDLCGWKLPIASSQYLDRHLGRIGSMMLAPAAIGRLRSTGGVGAARIRRWRSARSPLSTNP